jgi:hypothetical protein
MPQLNNPTRAHLRVVANNAAIAKPRDYRGEPDFTREYFIRALEGRADMDLYSGRTLISAFVLGETDYARHEALRSAYALAVWEDADGAVFHCTMDRAAYGAWVSKACDALDDEEDE